MYRPDSQISADILRSAQYQASPATYLLRLITRIREDRSAYVRGSATFGALTYAALGAEVRIAKAMLAGL